MKVTRFYTGPDNETHFEDVELSMVECSLEELGITELRSEPMKVKEIIFREVAGNSALGWHNAKHRELVITLDGEAEVEIGDGSKRRFGPGDMILAEDTTGRGHITRITSKQPRKMVFITLE